MCTLTRSTQSSMKESCFHFNIWSIGCMCLTEFGLNSCSYQLFIAQNKTSFLFSQALAPARSRKEVGKSICKRHGNLCCLISWLYIDQTSGMMHLFVPLFYFMRIFWLLLNGWPLQSFQNMYFKMGWHADYLAGAEARWSVCSIHLWPRVALRSQREYNEWMKWYSGLM